MPFDADELRPAYRGTTLAPWPNRVVDGIHRFDGVRAPAAPHRAEPRSRAARPAVVGRLERARRLRRGRHPHRDSDRAGRYPWWLVVSTTFRLGVDGLTQTVRATNLSDTPAPWGTGPHPYLVAGPAALDEWTLSLPADTVLEVTPDRSRARGPGIRRGRRRSLRLPRPPRARLGRDRPRLHRIDPGCRRRATVVVTDPSGSAVAMSWASECPWVQIHTADLPTGPGTRVTGPASPSSR